MFGHNSYSIEFSVIKGRLFATDENRNLRKRVMQLTASALFVTSEHVKITIHKSMRNIRRTIKLDSLTLLKGVFDPYRRIL